MNLYNIRATVSLAVEAESAREAVQLLDSGEAKLLSLYKVECVFDSDGEVPRCKYEEVI